MQVIRDMVAEEEEGDQTLLSLPANALRGTFLDAYHVLTLMLRCGVPCAGSHNRALCFVKEYDIHHGVGILRGTNC